LLRGWLGILEGVWSYKDFPRETDTSLLRRFALHFSGRVAFFRSVMYFVFPQYSQFFIGTYARLVRPSQSKAETQPKLQPAFFRLSAMIFPILHAADYTLSDDAEELGESC
jgi:hypothetical protein